MEKCVGSYISECMNTSKLNTHFLSMSQSSDNGVSVRLPRHVVMLVNNPCVNDSRVIKSAEALVEFGWQVTVICRYAANLLVSEVINGVTYIRIQPSPTKLSDLRAWITNKRQKSFHSKVVAINLPAHNDKNSFLSAKHASNNTRALCPSGIRIRIVLALKTTKRLLAFPAKVVYWLNEDNEFKRMSLPILRKMKFDVVHCHDLSTLPTGVALAECYRCKLVYDSHELEMHRNAQYTKRVWRKRRKLESVGIRRADAVITVSDSIADYLASDYGIVRPYVVLNSPDFRTDQKFSRTVRQDLKLRVDTPLAIYVGSVTINRGLENIVNALSFYPGLHFATVGPIRAQTRKDLEDIACSIDVADRLFFLPPVKPNEVVPYLVDADVSVLAIQNVCLSYYYCMPNKLLESTFAGVPVAVANLHELRKFVDIHACGLVMDEACPLSIAQTIKEILTKRDSFQISPEARAKIIIDYGWITQSIKLKSIYDAL